MKENILLKLSNKEAKGVYSVCSANSEVIRASLQFARENRSLLIIEATANQVNQFGGYTNMNAEAFRDFVYQLAREENFSLSNLILGGDHLGPLTWTDLPENEAMKNAYDLVYSYAKAGFTKIHLDTSMKLSSDSINEILSNEVIAYRSVELAKAAMAGYVALKQIKKDAIFPVFIIGSEVPIPGGSQEQEEAIQVTSAEHLLTTYQTFKDVYLEAGMRKIFDNVIAIVVQPGVEFGDSELFFYNRENAKNLTQTLKDNFVKLSFEGHSTDYQPRELLRQMVEDGITVLKVGPALTFAYREALFSLSMMEDILVDHPSNLRNILEKIMIDNPANWINHYHGDKKEQKFKRSFSYSDRARYYLPNPKVDDAIQIMIRNLSEIEIPNTLISQFMPYQYRKIKEGLIGKDPNSLIYDYIKLYLDDYEYATQSASLI